MKLSSLLSPKQVILDLKGETCAHALAHMVDHLVSRGLLDASLRDEVLKPSRGTGRPGQHGYRFGCGYPARLFRFH